MNSFTKPMYLVAKSNSYKIGKPELVVEIESIENFIHMYKVYIVGFTVYNFPISLNHIKQLYLDGRTLVYEAAYSGLYKEFSLLERNNNKNKLNNLMLEKALKDYIDANEVPSTVELRKYLKENIISSDEIDLQIKHIDSCNQEIIIPEISKVLQRIVTLTETMERVWYYPNF